VNRWSQASAILGSVVWLGLWMSPHPSLGLIERLLMLAVLVFTPLCIQLTATPDRNGHHPLPYRIAKILQPFAAVSAVIAFLLPAGTKAAFFTMPWLLLTAMLALHGVIRLLPRGLARADELVVDAGLIYISVGGVWLFLSRLGARPLGFSAVIVLLTAVHFHYSGFAAPIIVGMTGRHLAESDPTSWPTFRVLAVAVILGTPLLAVGITFSRTLETLAALLLAGSLFAFSFVVIFDVAASLDSTLARILLRCSGASCALAMFAACVYATGAAGGSRALAIPEMARLHGMLNSLGFVFCGLVAWMIARPSARLADPGVPFSRLASWFRVGPDFFARIHAVSTAGHPSGLVDDLSEYRRADFDPNEVHPFVRAFYTDTAHHELIVSAEWRRGFRFAARIYKKMAAIVGQMNLPLADEQALSISSRILPIRDEVDGRQNVRAWVRTYSDSGSAVYVAAYANHSACGETYMNIAFPLPGGNLSSILRMEILDAGGVLLTTFPSPHEFGDQGVYFANRLVPIRLPFNETIRVWPVNTPGCVVPEPVTRKKATAIAKHEVWLFSTKFLTLDYHIFPIQ